MDLSWIQWVLWVVAAALAVPCLVFAGQCLLASVTPAWRGPRRVQERSRLAAASAASMSSATTAVDRGDDPTIANGEQNPGAAASGAPRGRIAVLIPAHNESEHIAQTINTILPQLREGDRCVVIADNCAPGDMTAFLAREAGATVFERQHATERGKGFALAHGVAQLALDPPAVVVFVDADCRVSPAAIDTLAVWAETMDRPVQGRYLMDLPTYPGIHDMVSCLALTVKNQVRARAMARLGLPYHLLGAGMAWPWRCVAKVQMATGNIVEDMNHGIELALAGDPPVYCELAHVQGALPGQRKAATTQRTRWEHGHLATLAHYVPRLLATGLLRMRPGLIALGFDLAVPPLSLLVIGVTLASAAAWAISGMLGVSAMPAIVLTACLALVGLGAMVAWAAFARHVVSLKAILLIPFYVLSKLPIYLMFLVRPQKAWVRTAWDRAKADGDTQ